MRTNKRYAAAIVVCLFCCFFKTRTQEKSPAGMEAVPETQYP